MRDLSLRSFRLALAGCALLCAAPPAGAVPLFGVTGFEVVRENGTSSDLPPGSLAEVDPAGLGPPTFPSGASNAPAGVTLVADVYDSPNDGPVDAIDFSPSGQLFGAACDDFSCEFAAVASELLLLDPVAGSATSIGMIRSGGDDVSITGLAFQPGTATLFGVSGFLDIPGCSGVCLFTIDTGSAAATPIGVIPLGSGTPGGLAFAPDGTLYLTTITPTGGLSNTLPLDLLTLDPATGGILSQEDVLREQQFQFTAGGSTRLGFTVALQGLTVAPDGRLVASSANGNTTLFERVRGQVLDPSGVPIGDEQWVWRVLGDGGENLTDLAFAPIPEPATLGLLGLGLAGLAVARRR